MMSWSDVKLIPKKNKNKNMKGGSWINMRILVSHEGRILVHYEVKHHPCLSLSFFKCLEMVRYCFATISYLDKPAVSSKKYVPINGSYISH